MLVELKNGETYNGHLASCDTWMNLHLRDAICTSRDGDRFWKVAEVYIRGSTIKYMRIPDEVLDQVREDMRDLRKMQKENSKMRRQQTNPGGNAAQTQPHQAKPNIRGAKAAKRQ